MALYGEAEWAPSGLVLTAGVSLSLERLLTLPIPVMLPSPAKEAPTGDHWRRGTVG